MVRPWAWLTLAASSVNAISLDLASVSSIKSALHTIAYDLMSLYQGNETGQIPGLLPYLAANGQRYYWWETGAMFGTMIDYWYYTGDNTYNDELIQGITWQAGPERNFEPANQSADLGNDDQAFWAFTAMSAAEYNFPNPPKDQPQYLELAQAVFNRQTQRWDPSTCGGGMRWQVFLANQGYNYKNSGSNGCYFQLAARLAKYTGNQTYAKYAERTYDWMEAIGLINTTTWEVADGVWTDTNCTTSQPYVWSYNSAIAVYGSAVMWNITKDPIWQNRTINLIRGMSAFFPENRNIMYEYECETNNICNEDQQSFKAYTARFLAASSVVASWVEPEIVNWINASAVAAAKSCTGGSSGTLCGLDWLSGTYDGLTGAGEEMGALEIIGAPLMYDMKGPLTAKSGGTSKGNAGAGGITPQQFPSILTRKITAGDHAGASILTVLFGLTTIIFGGWIII